MGWLEKLRRQTNALGEDGDEETLATTSLMQGQRWNPRPKPLPSLESDVIEGAPAAMDAIGLAPVPSRPRMGSVMSAEYSSPATLEFYESAPRDDGLPAAVPRSPFDSEGYQPAAPLGAPEYEGFEDRYGLSDDEVARAKAFTGRVRERLGAFDRVPEKYAQDTFSDVQKALDTEMGAKTTLEREKLRDKDEDRALKKLLGMERIRQGDEGLAYKGREVTAKEKETDQDVKTGAAREKLITEETKYVELRARAEAKAKESRAALDSVMAQEAPKRTDLMDAHNRYMEDLKRVDMVNDAARRDAEMQLKVKLENVEAAQRQQSNATTVAKDRKLRRAGSEGILMPADPLAKSVIEAAGAPPPQVEMPPITQLPLPAPRGPVPARPPQPAPAPGREMIPPPNAAAEIPPNAVPVFQQRAPEQAGVPAITPASRSPMQPRDGAALAKQYALPDVQTGAKLALLLQANYPEDKALRIIQLMSDKDPAVADRARRGFARITAGAK